MDHKLASFLNEKAVYLEQKRLKAWRLNYIYKIVKPIRALLKGVLILLIIINFIIPILIPFTIFLGVLFLLLLLLNDPKEVFEARLKGDVLPRIFESINDTFKYIPYGYNMQKLIDSEILSKGYFVNTIEIEGEDYVKGQIENIDVEFFEIKFFKKVTNYTKTAGGCLLSLILLPVVIIKSIFDGDNESENIFLGVIKDTNVFFSGFFMYADFHKEFKGRVFMIPKNKDKFKDKIYEILEPKTLTKLNIENPYINDNYNIYASDVQTGYYVLSQSLIDRIHIISKKESALPIISFINGKMYFVIPWNKNFFGVNLITKIENGNYFLPYIDEINSFERIVKDLNLDTRIWSKV